jgi:YD repeat-containing protein
MTLPFARLLPWGLQPCGVTGGVGAACGQFLQEATDLVLAGAGMDFAFRRVYKNQAVYFGPMGANWDHSYNLRIRVWGINLIRSSGELRDDLYTKHPLFGQAGFNYWVPPDGRHGVIEENSNSYAWRSPGGVRFASQPDPSNARFHRISRIQDRFGNYLAFTYTEENLTKVEINHPARFVTLIYDTVDRIIEVRDHTGRPWTYEYDDWGDLVAVTSPATSRYPAGLLTNYEYSSSEFSPPLQHNLLRIIDPAGQLYLENDYGLGQGLLSFNRVVRQRQGNGEYFYEYETVVDEEFEFDYKDSEKPAVQVNQTMRNGQMVHFIFNRFGNMLLREEYLLQDGVKNLVRWRYHYNRDGALVGTITPEGCVTQFYYGRDDYLSVYGISDDEVATNNNLTSTLRMGFGNLLAAVQRSQRYDFALMNLSVANCQIGPECGGFWGIDTIVGMRDFAIVFVHLIVTLARLARPGGLRSVVAESVLVRHQLLILNRGRKRAPNLRATDRIIAGMCTLFMRPVRSQKLLSRKINILRGACPDVKTER